MTHPRFQAIEGVLPIFNIRGGGCAINIKGRDRPNVKTQFDRPVQDPLVKD